MRDRKIHDEIAVEMSTVPGTPLYDAATAATLTAEVGVGSPSEVIRAGFRTDYDVARVYRLTSAATLLGGVGAMLRAEREFDGWRRTVCTLTGAGYAAVGFFGIWISPSHIALWLQRRPRRTLVASFAPLLLSPLTGGERTPLYRLMTIGVATGTAVRGGRRDAQIQSALASMIWCAGASLQRQPAEDPLRTYVQIPVGFVLFARLASTASQVAYDSRNLFDQLFDFAYEREDLEPYVTRLTAALERMRTAVVAAATAEPAPEVPDALLRDQALASLGRLEERLGVLWVASLSRFDLEKLVSDASRGWRARIGPYHRTIILDARALKLMLASRAESFARLELIPPVMVTVAPEVTISGLRQLALVGACVTAGIANVARHAMDATHIEISLTSGHDELTLTVRDDGPAIQAPILDSQRRPSGLTHLREQLECVGGNLQLEPVTPHGLELRATLPPMGSSQTFEFWAREIREAISTSLDQAVRLAAVKCASGIVLGEIRARRAGSSRQGWVGATVLQLVLPVAAELTLTHSSAKTRAWLHAFVLGAAVPLTHHAARHGRAPASSWLNAFASRYAFQLPDARRASYVLASLNAVALLSGAARRGPWRARSDLMGELVSMMFGPALMGATINAAQPRIQTLEQAINEQLAEVENLHELADSFHSDHPAAPKILDLAPMVADPALNARLRSRLDAIESAEDALLEPSGHTRNAVHVEDPFARVGALLQRRAPALASTRAARAIWPEPVSYHMMTVGVPAAERLSSYLARALARRIWPATVKVTLDPRSLVYLPASAVTSAAFRREAMAAMDIIGRELNRTFGRTWEGGWPLQRVELRVSVRRHTGSIVCELVPWATRPGMWRRHIDRLHDRLARFRFSGAYEDRDETMRRLLATVSASLSEWTIFEVEHLEESQTIAVAYPHRVVNVVPRGVARIELHPQRHVACE